MKIDTNKLNYKVKNFKSFLKANWSDLVEYAEEQTGEKYDGLEPLLSKDEIIELAKEIWENNIQIYLSVSEREWMEMQEAQDDFERENQDGWERMNKMEQMGIKQIDDYFNYE